jgi:predicted phosphodiesterase
MSLLQKCLAALACGVMILLVVAVRFFDQPRNDGLVAHWVFDKSRLANSEIPDLAGNLNAKIVGEPAFLDGKPTAAIHLQKPSEAVVVHPKMPGNSELLPKEALTLTAWVRIDAGREWGGIVGCMQGKADAERGFVLGYRNENFYFGLATKKAGRATYLNGNRTAYVNGRWYHVAATYDGRAMRLYVNGERDADASTQQSGPILYAPAAPFVIGRYQDDDRDYPLDGAIKEVRVYRRALKDEEIAAQFNADKALAEAPAVAVPPRFVVAPYLQWPTRDSMTIMWETNAPGDGLLEFDTALPLKQKVRDEQKATLHEIRLTDLKPETTYVYRVTTTCADGRKLVAPPRTFTTAVREGSPFTFAVVGDTQNNAKMTGQIARLIFDRRPHFVVHCGDVVEEGAVKWRWVEELFSPSAELFAHVPVLPTIGNHEKDHANYYRYFSLPAPKYYYRYRYGNADFFVVDSNKSLEPGGEQYKWLDSELADSDAKWKFVYHHHPAWSSAFNDYGRTTGAARETTANVRHLFALYEKHHVDVVFNGHQHFYERTWPIRAGQVDRQNGVVYITTGGGGGELGKVGPSPMWFKAQLRVDHHFCYVTIHGGRFELKAFDQHGNLFDTLDIDKDRK